jgi:hypothetical protein
MWKIEELPNQHVKGSDWIAWLKSPDGLSVKIQISGRASEERARIITQQMAGLIRHDAE